MSRVGPAATSGHQTAGERRPDGDRTEPEEEREAELSRETEIDAETEKDTRGAETPLLETWRPRGPREATRYADWAGREGSRGRGRREEEGRGAGSVESGGKTGGSRRGARARGGGRPAEPGGGSRGAAGRASRPRPPARPTALPVCARGRWVLRETAQVQGGRAGIKATTLDSTLALSPSRGARRCEDAGNLRAVPASAGHR